MRYCVKNSVRVELKTCSDLVTGDPKWNEAGELYERFDLGLDDRKKTVGNCDAAFQEADLTDDPEPPSQPQETRDGVTGSGERVQGRDPCRVEKRIDDLPLPLSQPDHTQEEVLFNQFSKLLDQPGVN